eukprot:442509-Rhodomonas_salina.7
MMVPLAEPQDISSRITSSVLERKGSYQEQLASKSRRKVRPRFRAGLLSLKLGGDVQPSGEAFCQSYRRGSRFCVCSAGSRPVPTPSDSASIMSSRVVPA